MDFQQTLFFTSDPKTFYRIAAGQRKRSWSEETRKENLNLASVPTAHSKSVFNAQYPKFLTICDFNQYLENPQMV